MLEYEDERSLDAIRPGDESAGEAMARIAAHRARQPTRAEARASWWRMAFWFPCACLGGYWGDVLGALGAGLLGWCVAALWQRRR